MILAIKKKNPKKALEEANTHWNNKEENIILIIRQNIILENKKEMVKIWTDRAHKKICEKREEGRRQIQTQKYKRKGKRKYPE